MSPNDLAAINIVKIGAPIILTGVAMATYLTSSCRRAKDSSSNAGSKLSQWKVSVAPTPWRVKGDEQDSFRVFFTPIHPRTGKVMKEFCFTAPPDHPNVKDIQLLSVGDIVGVEELEPTADDAAASDYSQRIRIAVIKPAFLD